MQALRADNKIYIVRLLVIVLCCIVFRLIWIFGIAPRVPNALGGSKSLWEIERNLSTEELTRNIHLKLYKEPFGTVSPDFSQCYDPYAQSILSGKGFSDRDGKQTAYVAPLYSALIAGIYFIFGKSLIALRLVQILIDTLSCLLMFYIVKLLFGKETGIVASAIYSVYPLFIYQTGLVLTETLFMFLFVLFVYLFLKVLHDEKRIIFTLICGAVLGLATLTRPNTLLLPVIIVAGLFWYYSDKGIAMLKSIEILTGFSVIVMPWIIRNYIIFKKFVPISGIVYHNYEDPMGITSEHMIKTNFVTYILQKINILIQSPMETISNTLEMLYGIWYKTNVGRFDIYVVFIQCITLALSGYGIYLGLKRNRLSYFIILVILYYYFTVVIVSKWALVRYILPIMPFILVFCSLGVSQLGASLVKGRSKAHNTGN